MDLKHKVILVIQTVVNDKNRINQIINGASLVDSVDSLEFVKILVALESKFHVEFKGKAMLLSHYPSLDDLCNYITTHIDK